MMRIRLVPLFVVVLFFTGCASSGAQGRVADGSLYAALHDASASVLKDGRIAGSGSFIDQAGTFLTAAHVVDSTEHRLELLMPDGQVVAAEVFALDLGADIALLRPAQQVDDEGALVGEAFAPDAWLALATSPPPAGALVYVYGAPAMYRNLMLPGQIAADSARYNHQSAFDCYLHSVNLAGSTPPGISGGTWVDVRGRVIGVQCSHIGSESATTGMGFIAPLVDIQRLVRAGADQPAATFGAQVVSMWSQQFGFTKQFPVGLVGVALHSVQADGPAHRAGLASDLVITHVDGEATHDVNAFMDVVRSHAPGERITVRTVAPNTHEVKTYAVQLDELAW